MHLQLDAIERLKYQLRQLVFKRPATTEELRARGQWLDGSQLVAKIEITKQDTIDMFRVRQCRGGGGGGWKRYSGASALCSRQYVSGTAARPPAADAPPSTPPLPLCAGAACPDRG